MTGIRVTRLGQFLPIGWLFTLGSVLKLTKVAKFLGLLFPRYQLCINFDKKWVGLHFGRLFHKLIRSPWWGWIWFVTTRGYSQARPPTRPPPERSLKTNPVLISGPFSLMLECHEFLLARTQLWKISWWSRCRWIVFRPTEAQMWSPQKAEATNCCVLEISLSPCDNKSWKIKFFDVWLLCRGGSGLSQQARKTRNFLKLV
jgi:hypothetical protein